MSLLLPWQQQPASNDVSVNAEVATGTGTAYGAAPSEAPTAGQATGTGAANDSSASIGVNAGLASGTGQAYDATVTTTASLSVTAGSASGLGAAFDATVIIAVGAGFAVGTGQAYDATISAVSGAVPDVGIPRRRPQDPRYRPPRQDATVYAQAAYGIGRAYDATVWIDWTIDEQIFGLTDAQLVGAER